ncbi:MAG: thiol:disulfide interchange protein, partial [Bacteroidaceae bacterium]|nr:thiol:disulfide interchange protein [Bacteroidaceae bacterium]
MKKALSLISLFLLTATFALAQVSFNVAYKRVSPTEIDIVFTGKADRGWHIYSNGFGDGGPTQAEFSTDAKSGVELVGTLKPGAGEKKIHDPIFEMDVRMFEGIATFTQRVRLTEKNYNLKGYLTYGACNDQNCLPPTSVDCSLSGTDGPAAATPPSDNKTATAAEAQKNAEPQTPDEAQALVAATADSLQADTLMAVAMQQEADADELAQWYSPVTDELKAFG